MDRRRRTLSGKRFSGRVERRALVAGSLAAGLVLGGGVAYGFWALQSSAPAPTVTSGQVDLLVDARSEVANFGTDGLGEANVTAQGMNGSFIMAGLQPTSAAYGAGFFPGMSGAAVYTVGNSAGSDAPVRVDSVDVAIHVTFADGTDQDLVLNTEPGDYQGYFMDDDYAAQPIPVFRFSTLWAYTANSVYTANDGPYGDAICHQEIADTPITDSPGKVLVPGALDQDGPNTTAQRVCVQLTMADGTPGKYQNADVDVTVTFNGLQLARNDSGITLLVAEDSGEAASDLDLTGLAPAGGVWYPGYAAATEVTLTNKTGNGPMTLTTYVVQFTGDDAQYYTGTVVPGGTVAQDGTCTPPASEPSLDLADGGSIDACITVALDPATPDSQGVTATATAVFQARQTG
ncbi:MAG: hypothetical protein LBH13_10025 [Cellulomonadaceae bacterium]|nr:hypothetical protein [Cellulomonadaceae bacterium]